MARPGALCPREELSIGSYTSLGKEAVHILNQGCLDTAYENKPRTNMLKLFVDFAETDGGDLASNPKNLPLPHQEQDDF